MVAVAIALTLAAPLVTFVFGDKYADAAEPLAVLAWALPLAGMAVPYSSGCSIDATAAEVLDEQQPRRRWFQHRANALMITFVGITAAGGRARRDSTGSRSSSITEAVCDAASRPRSRGLHWGGIPRALTPAAGGPDRRAGYIPEGLTDRLAARGSRRATGGTCGCAPWRSRSSLGGCMGAPRAGCGTAASLPGGVTGAFTRLCGIDLESEHVRLARETVPSAELHTAPLVRIPFEDGAFDPVVSLDVLRARARGRGGREPQGLRRVLCPGRWRCSCARTGPPRLSRARRRRAYDVRFSPSISGGRALAVAPGHVR